MQLISIKTVQGHLPQLAPTDESGPVAEAFSGGVEIIERLADEWRELCAEGPCDQPFFRPEWIAAYVRAFAPEKRLLIITARVDGRLRAVLPLVEEWALLHGVPVRMLRGAANIHSCRFDLVHGAGQDGRTAAQAVWQWLRQKPDWDVIELRYAPEGGASESLLAAARSDGYPTGQWELPPAPYLTLPGRALAPEKALAGINSKFRQSVRRKRRKLGEEGELRLTNTTEAQPSELERFYQLERSGWKGRKGTAIACDAARRRFYDAAARTAAEFGYLSLYALECGDRVVAMQFCLAYGGRFFLLKPAYDEAFGKHSPGHVITHDILHDVVARGAAEYDFMSPPAEWKSRWAKETRAQASCYIFRPGLAGRALHFWKFRVMRAMRQLKRKLSTGPGRAGEAEGRDGGGTTNDD
jgi:CelD/BcsL family acetyltransferase involved in cellulose biosynthesis